MVNYMELPINGDGAVTVINEIDAQLLAVEFEKIPFTVRRVFVVSRRGDSLTRGNHRAGCNQMLILMAGRVSLTLKQVGRMDSLHSLDEEGSRVFIHPEDFVTYELLDSNSEILVLADQSYAESFEHGERDN